MVGPDPSVMTGQCGESCLRYVWRRLGGGVCVLIIPGKGDVYSSSEEQVAGRD